MIEAHLAAMLKGTIPVYVHTIEHPDGLVLVDTGLIDSKPELEAEWSPEPHPENIPRQVACVINTHLHWDHCGGNRLFPGIPIHVQKLELEQPHVPHDWVDFPGANYVVHDGDDEVLPGVRLITTPGHTKGHQSVVVDGAGVIGGDVAYFFSELGRGDTEGRRRVLEIGAPTWLAHVERPKVPEFRP